MRTGAVCYLCGGSEKLTRDHVPPKNLFTPPLPNNLITLPCCSKCNKSFSNHEEQLRVFLCSAVNISPQGKWLWKNKVVDSTFKRSPKLRHHFSKATSVETIQTPFGNFALPFVFIEKEPVATCLTKITKGLLAHFYPDVTRSELCFEVVQLKQFGINANFIQSIPVPLKFDERGNGAFKFWRGIANDDNSTGLWVYLFYDAISFFVRHERRASQNK